MNLSDYLEILKLVASGSVVAVILSWVHNQAKIRQERDRLLQEQRISKLKDDEKRLVQKIFNMPLDKLVDSAKDIKRRRDN